VIVLLAALASPRESADTPYPQVRSNAAENYGVTLTSVAPRIPRKDLAYAERRYDLEAAGPLPALVAWLSAFERNERIVALPRIELRRDGDEWRAKALVVVPYERETADNNAATSSARTGRAK
jgi:hypothetical protein